MKLTSDKLHIICLKLLIFLNLLDAVFTYVWVSLGLAKEANPFMDYLIAISPTVFLLYKVFIVNICVLFLFKAKSNFLCKVLTVPITTLYLWVLGIHLNFLAGLIKL